MAGGQMQQRTSTAVARVEQAVGSYRNPKVVTEWLTKAQEQGHLVSPATACGSLPEGCEVAITAVQVDIENETYDVGMGKRGLGGAVLDRISAGVGITGDPVASGRLDNGSDPRYCHFKWVGHYRSFDGQIMTLTGEKEMDLREGSPQVEAIIERCIRKLEADRKRANLDPLPEREARRQGREKGENQIREMRLHILAHAQTKARLRAIRSMGVRAAYPKEDLAKPFLMARVMFTGRTEDPVLKRTFGEMTAASFLGGTRALYGGAPAEPASRVIDVGGDRNGCGAPPPVGSVPLDEDDYLPEPEPPRAPAGAGGNGGSRPPAAQPPRSSGGIDTSKVYMPGKDKGVVLDATDKDLDYWAGRLARDLDEGKVQEKYLERTERQLAAINQEIANRRSAGSGDLPLDGEPPLYPEQGAGPEGEY